MLYQVPIDQVQRPLSFRSTPKPASLVVARLKLFVLFHVVREYVSDHISRSRLLFAANVTQLLDLDLDVCFVKSVNILLAQ